MDGLKNITNPDPGRHDEPDTSMMDMHEEYNILME
jgi:hypothetical protein